ncbi:MAG: hypothetical protein GYB64_09025 [Chloroflexi bacterium]|nr:hypothetical protein [Chloroflexota bacterium]
MNGFSGHADREGLLNWAGRFTSPPVRTFTMHAKKGPAR